MSAAVQARDLVLPEALDYRVSDVLSDRGREVGDLAENVSVRMEDARLGSRVFDLSSSFTRSGQDIRHHIGVGPELRHDENAQPAATLARSDAVALSCLMIAVAASTCPRCPATGSDHQPHCTH
jgi:hypothetical protein